MWLTYSAARQQLGMKVESVVTLVRMGVLEERLVHGIKQVAVAADDDGPAILERLYEQRGRCEELDDFAVIRDAGLILLGKKRIAPPTGFTQDAFEYMSRTGIRATVEDLRSLTGATEAIARRQILDWISATGGDATSTRSHFRSATGDHEATVLARLPEPLKDAPGTFLCPRTGHPDDKPSELEFAALSAILDERLFAAGALAIFRLAAIGTKPDQRRRLAAVIRLIDKKFPGRDFDDPFTVRDILESMLGPRWVEEGISNGKVAESVNRYHLLHQHCETYLIQAVPVDRRASLSQYNLTLPAGHERFFRQIRNDIKRYQAECSASRQNRIEKILDEPLEFLLVGRLRLKEHQELRDVCRAKIDEQIRTGRCLKEPKRFQHPYTTRLYNDRLRRCEQTAHFALWSWELLHAEMHKANEALGRRRRSYGDNAKLETAGRDAYVIEFLGVTPAEPNGPCEIPLMAQVADTFVPDEMPSLNDDQRRRRDQACTKWAFPKKVPAMAAGLPHFVWSRRHTAREANKLLRSVKCNGESGPLLLVAHEEFTHGMMFAHSALAIIADAGCRTGEVLQAPSKKAGYEPVPDPSSEDVFKSFEGIGKFKKKVTPLLSPDTFSKVTDLVVENAARWHSGKLPPAVTPNHHLKQMIGKAKQHFVFTVDDRMLNFSELGTLLRVLYLGWHGLQGHDVRHVFNGMARRDGISREVRQRLLDHSSPRTNDGYGPATATELNRQRIVLSQHTAEKAASLLRSLDGGTSEKMREADRELRKAELVRSFYAKEGEPDLEGAARAEVTHWANELARATAEHTGAVRIIESNAI